MLKQWRNSDMLKILHQIFRLFEDSNKGRIYRSSFSQITSLFFFFSFLLTVAHTYSLWFLFLNLTLDSALNTKVQSLLLILFPALSVKKGFQVNRWYEFMCPLEILGMELCFSPKLHRTINVVAFSPPFSSFWTSPAETERQT